MKIKEAREALKLCKGAITEIITHPKRKDCVLVGGANGKVSCFSLNPLKLEFSFKLFNMYSTCLVPFGEGLCVGSNQGEIIYMKLSGEIIKKFKISEECLSSIVNCDSYLVVTSFDGIVRFLNKSNFEVEKEVDLEVPIWDSEFFENKIYAAGNPSFIIDCNSFELKKINRQDSFKIYNNKLYACSDEKGLTCLKNNSNSYIPCNFMLALPERLMIFSEECVSEIKHETQMEWKCHRIKEIEKGVVITSGCTIGNIIILGDNEGSIYKMEYEMERISTHFSHHDEN